MKLSFTFLKHKIARRLFAVFLLCAIVPTSLLAVYSLQQVTLNTTEYVEDNLRQRAKKFGLNIFSHLQLLDQKLQLQISQLATADELRFFNVTDGFTDILQINFTKQVAFDLLDDAVVEISGIPLLNDGELKQLADGHPVIKFHKSPHDATKGYLFRTASHTQDLIVGVINTQLLWGGQENYGDQESYCILGEFNTFLFCSNPQQLSTFESSRSAWGNKATGNTHAANANYDLQLGFWTLFLRPSFYYPELIVVIGIDNETALAPIIELKSTFILLAVVTFIFIVLLSINQIRKYLGPLEALLGGITRIAQNDFSKEIAVSSDDEFTKLAQSFNAMAKRIFEQFQFLTTLSKIDQLILSSHSFRENIEAVLSLTNKAVSAKTVHIGLLNHDNKQTIHIFSESGKYLNSESSNSYSIDSADITELSGLKTLTIECKDRQAKHYGYLPSCEENTCFVLVPILLNNTLEAVLFVQLMNDQLNANIHQRLRDLADRFTIALEKTEWEQKLYQQAHHDPLTDLPNRQLLNDRLDQSIKHAAHEGAIFSLIFIDLDRFKTVNDSLGHTAGDDLLIQASKRLKQTVKTEDTVSRLGGDEFVIITLPSDDLKENTSQSSHIADNIIKAMSLPFILTVNDIDHEVRVGASIGIASYPTDATTSRDLLKNADSAMYLAKSKGRNNFQFYSEDLNKEAMKKLTMETDLHRAIENNELELYYQPKVDTQTGEILGAEALIRWNHPSQGMISPFFFIPIAEENGLINPIGTWTLYEACRQNKEWNDTLNTQIKVSVNISPKQFEQLNLVDLIKDTLDQTGLPAKQLDLEIVESTAMHDIQQTIDTVNELKQLGVYISIDDYGTGFSTLSYLKKFPVDVLKIDREFVINLAQDSGDRAIISSTILLAHNLGMSVVAEGVEDDAQLAILRSYGCEEIQGYYFSPPVPAAKFEELIRNGGFVVD
jgi:diguanylate cyclase (GGDEF)-like protein